MFKFDEAIRGNDVDVDLCIRCLGQLCLLLFTMDHHNYTRYLTYYFKELLYMTPEEANLLIHGGISVGRSDSLKSRTPIDLAILQVD